MVCQNGGVCKNNKGHATCLCQPGWTGTQCQTDSGVTGSQDPTFIDTAIPTIVPCTVGQSCNIPLLLKGAGVTSSNINFGQVDNGITPSPVSVDRPTSGGPAVVHVPVTPTTEGEKHICVQVNSVTSGTKSSEACFTIKATQPTGGSIPAPPAQSKPQFTPSTLPDHSTVQCMAGSTCHIYLGTQPASTANTCPSVIQSGVTHIQSIQSFPLVTSPSPGNVCSTVMAFTPSAEQNGMVCFTPTQASDHGQEKCFNINVKQENCSGPVIDLEAARESTNMGRTRCKCTLASGKEVVVINKRPKATTAQLLKAAGIGAGSVTGAIAIATIIYMIVGKIKESKNSNPNLGDNKTNSDRMTPRASKPRPQLRQRR
ncbi:uncharacterized protein PB18E9.04c-like [Pecten maximus]|uniref:uncharacterized protein PB18E9.04c-like n=1 Tax=Pecten maximus TaxID=6579 RepID=UPI0014583A8B|nr:uncharacterized protein PB18E9.04c-like [Pecten maximus]